MNNPDPDIVEIAAQWIEKLGFEGDLSVITAGLHDIRDGMDKVYSDLLPYLIKLDPNEKEVVLEVVVDILVEFNHIRTHADSAIERLIEIRDFIDKSPISPQRDLPC
jgi:hypothetical protein